MMKHVQIKKIISQEDEILYRVNAIVLQSKDGENKKKIPHPLGTETMLFKSLDKAKEAIILAGFEFILPDGEEHDSKEEYKIEPYDKKIMDALLAQTKDNNPNIVAAAISALSGINHPECLNLYIEKMSEDNEAVRNNSIEAIIKYGKHALKPVINALNDSNWVKRNSAIICLQKLCEVQDIDLSKIIDTLLSCLHDNNPIVKCSVIKALGQAYKFYKIK